MAKEATNKAVNSAAEALRAKTIDELKAELLQLRKASFNLRFQRANGQLENTASFRQVRRQIAQVNTVLGEKVRATAAG